MKDGIYADGIPMGFGMALAQNEQAFARFAQMTQQQKQAVLAGVHEIGSKEEMRAYVEKLVQ